MVADVQDDLYGRKDQECQVDGGIEIHGQCLLSEFWEDPGKSMVDVSMEQRRLKPLAQPRAE